VGNAEEFSGAIPRDIEHAAEDTLFYIVSGDAAYRQPIVAISLKAALNDERRRDVPVNCYTHPHSREQNTSTPILSGHIDAFVFIPSRFYAL